MMQQGDLVHIPQGVELWCDAGRGMKVRTTQRPTIGVYLSGTNAIYQVYANGHEWNLKRRHVYPIGGQKGIS